MVHWWVLGSHNPFWMTKQNNPTLLDDLYYTRSPNVSKQALYTTLSKTLVYLLNLGLIGIQVVDMLIDTHGLSMGLSF
jgi:hypothetical protein